MRSAKLCDRLLIDLAMGWVDWGSSRAGFDRNIRVKWSKLSLNPPLQDLYFIPFFKSSAAGMEITHQEREL
ncbi:MAG: hypothetical protein F6K14_19290 [Symploca sp. SIO2C1]|nr:hypothetical protein [Symploca sp. SIO2C1]